MTIWKLDKASISCFSLNSNRSEEPRSLGTRCWCLFDPSLHHQRKVCQTVSLLEWNAHKSPPWSKPHSFNKLCFGTQIKCTFLLFHFAAKTVPPHPQPRIPLEYPPNSQMELITKPHRMPTKPRETLRYPTTRSLSPSGRITPSLARIPCLIISAQTICAAENVNLCVERPSGTCAHHIGLE